MSHVRRLARIAPTGRIAVQLTPDQRDLLLAAGLPRDLAQLLNRAAVDRGKLQISARREGVDALIAAAAKITAADRTIQQGLSSLLRYLESRADRFAEDEDLV